MAATPFPPPPLHASFSPFNIFNDGGAARNTPPPVNPSLPGGPCNFVDLTHGPNGPRCGCRRFWSRQVTGAGNSAVDHMSWCMCSHHACFHDDVQNTQGQPTSAPVVDNMRGQENERPKSNRAPLSPVQDFTSFHMPNSMDAAAMDLTAFNFDAFPLDQGLDVDLPPANPPGPPPQDNDSMPDTMSWKNVLSTQGGQTPLPPLPSQCLLPDSQAASTTTSGSLRYLRPFGGKGLNTLSSVPLKNCDNISNENANRDIASVPASNPAVGSGTKTLTPGLLRGMQSSPASPALPAGRDAETLQGLADTVNEHEQRLDRLETGSIYNAAHEECTDRHDLADLRVTELETRMDDVEKKLSDDTTSVGSTRHTTQRDDDATISVVSGPVADAAAVAGSAALSSQLETLKACVKQLSASSVPSYSSPWELEVVFLPFPLKGIWQAAQEFKTPRLSAGRDEWVQTPNTNSRATPDPQALAACDEWVGEDSAWLLPRACVPGRMIDQRLRSRGLIKTVSVRGPDARSVQLAVGHAFESILCLMPSPADPRSPYASDPRVERFFGFRQPWVPLRKVHKDSRLRLLSPAELVTPVSWDTTFLMNVVMKATGIHRLYITQPEAYLQDSHLSSYRGVEPGWTWQKLRELTRVHPESQASNSGSEILEADALEEYWQYNARLDEPSRPRLPPMDLHQARERALTTSRTSDGSTQQFFTGPSNIVSSMSPILMRGQSPLGQRERRGSRPPSIRAVSVPPIHSPVLSSPRSSRRKSSCAIPPTFTSRSNNGRHSSPLVPGRPSPRLSLVTNPPPISIITKDRRRATRSPSIRFQHTPRYSHRSYSRSPSVAPFFQNMVTEESLRGERRVTSFAYATPFSNAPPEYPSQRVRNRTVRLLENDDEDMASDDDHGSSTDNDDDDDDPDIDVYEDENDMLDNIESDSDHHHHHHHRRRSSSQPRQAHNQPLQEQQSSSQPQGPEDEVWPGIEDNAMSDEENVNPHEAEEGDEMDDGSDTSSEPSEYASTQRAWQLLAAGGGREMTHGLEGDEAGVGSTGFHIHEDEGEDESDGQHEW